MKRNSKLVWHAIKLMRCLIETRILRMPASVLPAGSVWAENAKLTAEWSVLSRALEGYQRLIQIRFMNLKRSKN